jgi:hypothetical protein
MRGVLYEYATLGNQALRRASSPARIYGDRLKVGFPFQGVTKMIYLDSGPSPRAIEWNLFSQGRRK